MKIPLIGVTSIAISLLFSSAALAQDDETIKCGEHFIDGESPTPLSKAEVQEAYGEPSEKSGVTWGQATWVYEEEGKTLTFDANNNLESVRDIRK